jgi:hypothetical protein
MSKADVALQQAIRSLEYQERTLDSLRTRAAITLTLGYLATGFLFDVSSTHSGWFWAGVVALLVLTLAVVAVHWPVRLWVTFNAYVLVSAFVDDDATTETEMARDLAIDAQDLYDRNESVLRFRSRLLVLSIVSASAAIGSFLGNVVLR